MSVQSSPLKSQEKLRYLARQGNSDAIAKILNAYCKPQGVTVKVRWKEQTLFILCEAKILPEKQELVHSFKQLLLRLEIQNLNSVVIYGRRTGQTDPSWNTSLTITSMMASTSPVNLSHWLNQGKLKGTEEEGVAKEIEQQRASPKPVSQKRFLRFSIGASHNASMSAVSDLSHQPQFTQQKTALLHLDEILEVLHIPVTTILPVPYMVACVLGICHYRGNMLWMVDLAHQLGDRAIFNTSKSYQFLETMLVCRHDGELMGLVVPQVLDIETYRESEIEAPNPSLFSASLLPFIQHYLPHCLSPILSIPALIQDAKLQTHHYTANG